MTDLSARWPPGRALPAAALARCWLRRPRRRRRRRRCRSSTPTCTTATTPGSACRPRRPWRCCARPGLKRAMVSSSSDEGTQKLLRRGARPRAAVAAPLPQPRRDRQLDARRRASSTHLESRLKQYRYVAIGEYHVYGADADLPVVRRVVQLAREHKLFLHSHSDADAIERQFRQDPDARILWAHAGLRRAGEGARDAAQAQEPVVRPGLPQRPRHHGPRRRRLARGLPGVSRSLPGRHRHLHARALALRRRARALVAPVAGRPAARRWPSASPGRTARRCSAPCWSGARREGAAALPALLLAAAVPAWAACPPPPEAGARLDSGRGAAGLARRAGAHRRRPPVRAAGARCARPTRGCCASTRRCPSTATA